MDRRGFIAQHPTTASATKSDFANPSPAKPSNDVKQSSFLPSLSRFHSIGNKRSKSQSNIATYPAQFNRSIHVTNRAMSWKECRIYMSITLFVTIRTTYCIFTSHSLKAFTQSLVNNIVRNFLNTFVEHSATFIIGTIQ